MFFHFEISLRSTILNYSIITHHNLTKLLKINNINNNTFDGEINQH